MIDMGVIDWVVSILKDAETLSDYSVEYGTALLMNLCLRSGGKLRCENISMDLLGTLVNLLEHSNPQARTYVNGTLYSVLTRPKIREKAAIIGLAEILNQLSRHSEEQFQRQIEYILRQLESTEADDTQSDDEEDEDEDDADDEGGEMEEDGEEDELLELHRHFPQGETLLCGEYIVQESIPRNPSHTPQHAPAAPGPPYHRSSQHGPGGFSQRPTTPLRTSGTQFTARSSRNAVNAPILGVVASETDRSRRRSSSKLHNGRGSALSSYNDGQGDTTTSPSNRPRINTNVGDKKRIPPPRRLTNGVKGDNPESAKSRDDTNKNKEEAADQDQLEEYYDAFQAKPKVPRSPLY